MKRKLLSVGALTVGILALVTVNWAVASKPAEDSCSGYTNPDRDLATLSSGKCLDVETGPVVKATGPVVISSPTTATLQLTCYPVMVQGQAGPPQPCEGQILTYMYGAEDSKNYVHLPPNVPTIITLRLTAAGQALVAKEFAKGPGESKGSCPIVAHQMKDSDNHPRTTVSHAPDFVVG